MSRYLFGRNGVIKILNFFKLSIGVVAISFLFTGCTNYSKKGIEEYQKGNYQGAIEDFNKAIDKNPKDDVALETLGLVYRDFDGAPNHRDNAYLYINKAIEVCPEDDTESLARHYGQLADLYRTDGNYEEANKYFKKSIDLNPDDYEMQYFYGISLYLSGNYEAAKVHAKKSLKLNPDYQNAKNFLSRL